MVSTSSLEERVRVLDAENARLRHVIRRQGEFILSLKVNIRDFLGNA